MTGLSNKTNKNSVKYSGSLEFHRFWKFTCWCKHSVIEKCFNHDWSVGLNWLSQHSRNWREILSKEISHSILTDARLLCTLLALNTANIQCYFTTKLPNGFRWNFHMKQLRTVDLKQSRNVCSSRKTHFLFHVFLRIFPPALQAESLLDRFSRCSEAPADGRAKFAEASEVCALASWLFGDKNERKGKQIIEDFLNYSFICIQFKLTLWLMLLLRV